MSNIKCTFKDILETDCYPSEETKRQPPEPYQEEDHDSWVKYLWKASGKKMEVESCMTICMNHKKAIMKKFHSQKFCSDPLETHKKAAAKNMTKKQKKPKPTGHIIPLKLELAISLNELGITSVIPDQKLCYNCRTELEEKVNQAQMELERRGDESRDSQLSQASVASSQASQASIDDPELSRIHAQEISDIIISANNASPFKLHGAGPSQKARMVSEKVHKLQKPMQETFATALGVDVAEVERTTNENTELANDMRQLLSSVRLQIELSTNYKDKIQLLTLIPKSWSVKKAVDFFCVTEYMVKKAVSLRDSQGILAVPKIYSRIRVSEETEIAVRAMYEDDEYSRQLPGQKDCITVDGAKVSKRLLLVKIEELYRKFKEKHPDLKIGLSKFCSMRPKWCVLVGSKGTHSVCTCIQHENTKLLASETDFDYKVYISKYHIKLLLYTFFL